MSRITAIRTRRRAGKGVKIFLDGRFAFSLGAKTVLQEGLKIGQELSGDRVTALAAIERHERCLSFANRFLSYRPRSEFELRERLQRRGFDKDSIEGSITTLKDQGYVDDIAFARYWKENRETFSPRSQWLTGLELRRKGIADDVISTVIRDADDSESAYQAALGKAYRLPSNNYDLFRRRLGEFLKRRGFSYEVINVTVKRLWQEVKTEDQTEA